MYQWIEDSLIIVLSIVFYNLTSLPTIAIFFFFNDTATTEIYTLSLHDALPISTTAAIPGPGLAFIYSGVRGLPVRSEEHTSELQSLRHLVCRLLLEKKKRTPWERLDPLASSEASQIGRDESLGCQLRNKVCNVS